MNPSRQSATRPARTQFSAYVARNNGTTPGGGRTPEPGGLAPSVLPEGLIVMLDARAATALEAVAES